MVVKRKKKKLPFAKRLQDMIFDEVSLVGKPANELSQFVLHKSADTEVAGDEEVDKISLSNQVEIEGEEIRMSENLNEENLSSMLEETLRDTVICIKTEDTVTALEATAEEQDGKISELEKAVSEMSVEDVDEEDAILKSADPAIQELVAKAQADADEAMAVAEAEKEARLSKEFSDKVGTIRQLTNRKRSISFYSKESCWNFGS